MHNRPLPPVENPNSKTAKARAVRLAEATERALDDPAQLARAARIIRLALERKRLQLAELTPPPNPGNTAELGDLPEAG